MYSFLHLGNCCVYVHTSHRTCLSVTTQSCQPAMLYLTSTMAAVKPFFWRINWLLPLFQGKSCLPVTDTRIYRENHKDCRQRVSTGSQIDWRT